MSSPVLLFDFLEFFVLRIMVRVCEVYLKL